MSKDPLHTPAHLLVVDDEPDLRTLYELTLVREGHAVSCAGSLSEARELLAQHRFDLLITDMRLPDGLGLALIQELALAGRSERTVVVTAHGSAENAVEALKQGAFDYLTKPLDLKQFRAVVATALQRPARLRGPRSGEHSARTDEASAPAGAAHAEPTPHSKLNRGPQALRDLVGTSRCMEAVRERIAKVASSMAPVVVLGESGTGKELVARAIHRNSHRAQGPFVAVNCGAIPETLIEAEFFGARKGAYTGATADRDGYFSAAAGGTLFLDEIGDLPVTMQAKLLRVIQERRVRPLGGVQEELVDVRIVCATHKDLVQAVAQRQFRQDLYYRLNVIEIKLPPLRERRADIHALTLTLLGRICHENGQPTVDIAPQALAWLQQHTLAGNVRELENLLHRALALCDGACIVPADLMDTEPPPAPAPPEAAPEAETDQPNAPATGHPPAVGAWENPAAAPPPLPNDLQQHLDEQERAVLVRALQSTGGNRTAAAALLGLNLRQMRYRIARLAIQVGTPDSATDTDTDANAHGEPCAGHSNGPCPGEASA